MRVFGSSLISRLLSFQYTPIICLKKTHLHKIYIVQWVAKFLACSSKFWVFPITLSHLNVAWCYKMVTDFRQHFLGGEGRSCISNLLETNHSVGVSFALKFCTDTILHFWVTTYQVIFQYANRYTKVSKGVLRDSLLDSFLQNHNLQKLIQQFHLTDHGSIPLDSILISSL